MLDAWRYPLDALGWRVVSCSLLIVCAGRARLRGCVGGPDHPNVEHLFDNRKVVGHTPTMPSPIFNVTVVDSGHGPPTLFVHRLNNELETWTTFEPSEAHDDVLGRLGFARAGEWSTSQHGSQHCAATRSAAL